MLLRAALPKVFGEGHVHDRCEGGLRDPVTLVLQRELARAVGEIRVEPHARDRAAAAGAIGRDGCFFMDPILLHPVKLSVLTHDKQACSIDAMRPERAVVKKAIQDTDGNLRRSAALLGCTRQTLYTWIYQLGLERLAGIRMDTRGGPDTRERLDTRSVSSAKSGVQSAGQSRTTFHVVEAQEAADPIIPATVKIRESIWKRLKIQAIEDDTTMGAIVEKALESVLAPRQARRAAGGKQQQ